MHKLIIFFLCMLGIRFEGIIAMEINQLNFENHTATQKALENKIALYSQHILEMIITIDDCKKKIQLRMDDHERNIKSSSHQLLPIDELIFADFELIKKAEASALDFQKLIMINVKELFKNAANFGLPIIQQHITYYQQKIDEFNVEAKLDINRLEQLLVGQQPEEQQNKIRPKVSHADVAVYYYRLYKQFKAAEQDALRHLQS